jgi:hypothetical protein
MKLNVGQIVFLLSQNDLKIFPAQIVEEIKRKTIEGETISHTIRLPDQNLTEVSLNDVKASIFSSLGELESKMVEDSNNKIKIMIEDVEKMSEIFNQKDDSSKIEEGVMSVDMGNGVKGNINLSDIP